MTLESALNISFKKDFYLPFENILCPMSQTYFFQSPLGTLEIQAAQNELHSVQFSAKTMPQSTPAPTAFITSIFQYLTSYFEKGTTPLPQDLNPSGTLFQKKVWALVQSIPSGSCCTYKQLAQQLGDENATRALGSALSKNPILILIPCHRVVGSNGTLTGYAGGLERKKWLLEHEGFLKQKSLLL